MKPTLSIACLIGALAVATPGCSSDGLDVLSLDGSTDMPVGDARWVGDAGAIDGAPILDASGPVDLVVPTPTSTVSYQISPQHDGHAVDPKLKLPLVERWRKHYDHVVTEPLIADDIVFIDAVKPNEFVGTLFAYNASSGSELWAAKLADGAPAYDHGRVFMTNGAVPAQPTIDAWDGPTGQHVWSKPVPGATGKTPRASGVVAVDGSLFGVAIDGGLPYALAINETDGSTRWLSPPMAVSAPSSVGLWPGIPAVVGGSVYVAFDCAEVRAFSAVTGAPLWAFQPIQCATPEGIALPAVYGGDVYAWQKLVPGEVWSFDATSGMKTPLVEIGARSIAFADGRMFVPDINPNHQVALTAYDVKTGNKIWALGTHDVSVPTGNPVAVNDLLLVAGISDLYILDAATGATIQPPVTYRTAMNDDLLLGSGRYNLSPIAVGGGRVAVRSWLDLVVY